MSVWASSHLMVDEANSLPFQHFPLATGVLTVTEASTKGTSKAEGKGGEANFYRSQQVSVVNVHGSKSAPLISKNHRDSFRFEQRIVRDS